MNDMNPAFLKTDTMADVQSSHDSRNLPIERVGVRGIRFPIRAESKDGGQRTVGQISLDVSLPGHVKGTHMSRFMALMQEFQDAVGPAGMENLMKKMLPLLEAQRGQIDISYTHFVNKSAPVSGIQSLMDYEVVWTAKGSRSDLNSPQTNVDLSLKVVVPVMSLCPCSKEISDFGAHNQRSHVTISVDLKAGQTVQVEDLISIAESQASCELWGLLKRTDEKYVTETSYQNPKFVEDLVRDVAAKVKEQTMFKRFVVEAENFESIHNHSAYALISSEA
jgi:GTP cyclohydrolase I